MIPGKMGHRVPDTGTCALCAHFVNEPSRIEALIPGLGVLGSARASVLGQDGICLLLDRIVSGRDGCGRFTPVSGQAPPTKDRDRP